MATLGPRRAPSTAQGATAKTLRCTNCYATLKYKTEGALVRCPKCDVKTQAPAAPATLSRGAVLGGTCTSLGSTTRTAKSVVSPKSLPSKASTFADFDCHVIEDESLVVISSGRPEAGSSTSSDGLPSDSARTEMSEAVSTSTQHAGQDGVDTARSGNDPLESGRGEETHTQPQAVHIDPTSPGVAQEEQEEAREGEAIAGTEEEEEEEEEEEKRKEEEARQEALRRIVAEEEGARALVEEGEVEAHREIVEEEKKAAENPLLKIKWEALEERYIISKELGAGAQGKVFLCRRRSDNKEFAVKCIRLPLDRLVAVKEQQDRYCHMLKDGTHIIIYHEIILSRTDTDGMANMCIVMDYAPQGDLSAVIRDAKGHFSEESLVSYSLQMIKALDYLHRQKVLHLDVKPENILVGPRGDLKLSDFDSSRALTSTFEEADFEVTAAFTAPEVDTGKCTPASDVFSLGVVIMCLAALPDFPDLDGVLLNSDQWKDHDKLKEAMKKIFSPIKAPDACNSTMYRYSKTLVDLITAMVAYDPNARPSLSDLRDKFEELGESLLLGECDREECKK